MTKCYNYRQAKMKVRRETYEYDLAGLPYPVVLLNVPVQRCPKCEEHAVTIPDLEGLHVRLALDIVSAPRPLQPEEIRFLRKTMDWTAEEMGRIVVVDVKTISRWENGKQKIGPVAAFKKVVVVPRLPKTRSGKILRGTMVSIADGKQWKMPATIDDPAILDEITEALQTMGYAQ
mgnify:CR=1 FL=1